ncbi:hypothetical protein C8R45DRAFT_1083309 [Mycena sanguinolenta]|nr:hypothetical protein C8R45DRAFT_1083309 [Mycena sanguinolenta]
MRAWADWDSTPRGCMHGSGGYLFFVSYVFVWACGFGYMPRITSINWVERGGISPSIPSRFIEVVEKISSTRGEDRKALVQIVNAPRNPRSYLYLCFHRPEDTWQGDNKFKLNSVRILGNHRLLDTPQGNGLDSSGGLQRLPTVNEQRTASAAQMGDRPAFTVSNGIVHGSHKSMTVISVPWRTSSSIGGPGTIDEAMTVNLGTSGSSDVLESAAAAPEACCETQRTDIPRLRTVKITAGRRAGRIEFTTVCAALPRVHTSVVCLGRSTNIESSDTSLLVFGNDDGGGGPLPKMLENLRRMRAVTNNHRELPPVHMGRFVDQFSDYLAESSQGGKVLPNWKGELSTAERRRRTALTVTIGSIKKGNRHSEILLRDVEMVATMASLSGRKYVYPKQKIDEAWEKVLFNQFHEVLSGSAIGMVYDDAEKLYAEVREVCEEMIDDALDVILGGSTQRLTAAAVVTDLDQLVAYNTTPFSRCDVVQCAPDPGRAVGGGWEDWVRVREFRGWGEAGVPDGATSDGGVGVLACLCMQLTISRGRTTSLLDVQLGRELIQEGATGGLVIFEDRPNYWDAWDVEIHHLEKATPLEFTKVSVVAQGPLRASVEVEVVYGQSRINVTISLDAVPSPMPGFRSMFHFDACVDWHQRHEFLKFELPLAINSDNATYETQFDWFEVCGHKYADLRKYPAHLLTSSRHGARRRAGPRRARILLGRLDVEAAYETNLLEDIADGTMLALRPNGPPGSGFRKKGHIGVRRLEGAFLTVQLHFFVQDGFGFLTEVFQLLSSQLA